MSFERPETQEQQTWIQRAIQHPLWIAGGILLSGFISGIATFEFVLKITNHKIISQAKYESVEANLKQSRISKLDETRKNLKLQIISPKDQDAVPQNITVNGQAEKNVPANTQIWLFVKPHNDKGVSGYYPQGDNFISFKAKGNIFKWNKKAIIGGADDQDKGRKFDLMVVAVDNESAEPLVEYVRGCRLPNIGRIFKDRCYSDPDLPKVHAILTTITVTRE